MKRIGLLGGTSWPSTQEYYRLLNEAAAEQLGGHHSADLLLRSIDYHEIKSRYNDRWEEVPPLLEQELRLILTLPIDCLILCNNTLHKAWDAIRDRLAVPIPFFHAVELTAQHARGRGMKRLLLLATRFTLEDGFFARGLKSAGLEVTVPDTMDMERIQSIQARLAAGEMQPEFVVYFHELLARYAHLDAAVLACTELPLTIDAVASPLVLIDPMRLQVEAAMSFALSGG